MVSGDKRVGDGGRSNGHRIQSGLVTGNLRCVGRSVSFVMKTLDKVEEALPGRLQNKGAILVDQS